MAVSLGKRKRERKEHESDGSNEDEGALRSMFQRAFEAKFKPLERVSPVIEPEAEEQDEASGSDWQGLSEDEENDLIETYHHESSRNNDHDAQQQERKAFMTSKPPLSVSKIKTPQMRTTAASEDDQTEATNLKHDLALQRLLKESHLLESNAFSTQTPEASGKSRLKALDLRLKDLGAKKSSLEQQRMPLSHRRGITTKATDREQRRRKEAVENGVILEKVKHVTKGNQTRRVRSVGGPAIGRFSGGTLRLGARDLRSIQGPEKGRRRR